MPFGFGRSFLFRLRRVKCLKSPRRVEIFMSFHFLIIASRARFADEKLFQFHVTMMHGDGSFSSSALLLLPFSSLP
jgi:hypothetical protein